MLEMILVTLVTQLITFILRIYSVDGLLVTYYAWVLFSLVELLLIKQRRNTFEVLRMNLACVFTVWLYEENSFCVLHTTLF